MDLNTVELLKRAKSGDEKSFEQLVDKYKISIKKISKKYSRTQTDEEAFQSGLYGFWIAVKKFDPSRQMQFSSYMFMWVRRLVKKYNSRLIKIPEYYLERKSKFYTMRRQLGSSEAISKKTGVSISEIEKLDAVLPYAVRSPIEDLYSLEYTPDDFSDEVERSTLIIGAFNKIEKDYPELIRFVDMFKHWLSLEIPFMSLTALTVNYKVSRGVLLKKFEKIKMLLTELLQTLKE